LGIVTLLKLGVAHGVERVEVLVFEREDVAEKDLARKHRLGHRQRMLAFLALVVLRTGLRWLAEVRHGPSQAMLWMRFMRVSCSDLSAAEANCAASCAALDRRCTLSIEISLVLLRVVTYLLSPSLRAFRSSSLMLTPFASVIDRGALYESPSSALMLATR